MLIIKRWLDQILNSSLDFDSEVVLNKKYVVAVSYLLLFCVCVLAGIGFLLLGHFAQSALHFTAASLGLLGSSMASGRLLKLARACFSWLLSIYTVLVSILFFGSDSGFHWLLAVLPVYSVTAFTVYQRRERAFVCVLALLSFVFVEVFAPKTTRLINDDSALLTAAIMFACVSIMVSLMTGIVVTRLRSLNMHLKSLSELDDLTRLNNRRKVLAEAVNVFADSVINNEKCCFAILDIDHFKQINDVYGHDVGDTVLRECAKVMKASVHSSYWLGRYGGEEFIVVMPNTYIDDASREMERLRIQLSDSVISLEDGRSIQLTASIGVASILPTTERYEEILARADKSLYNAKENGRNQVVVDHS